MGLFVLVWISRRNVDVWDWRNRPSWFLWRSNRPNRGPNGQIFTSTNFAPDRAIRPIRQPNQTIPKSVCTICTSVSTSKLWTADLCETWNLQLGLRGQNWSKWPAGNWEVDGAPGWWIDGGLPLLLLQVIRHVGKVRPILHMYFPCHIRIQRHPIRNDELGLNLKLHRLIRTRTEAVKQCP